MENCCWKRLEGKERSFDSASILENELGSLNTYRIQKLQIQGPGNESQESSQVSHTENESSMVLAILN